ncbi:MAG: GGDEF domain-containing protein [Granulosicoccus sp.]|nr:GGDEF domain-containing protein [Granulosicoccus sp.]
MANPTLELHLESELRVRASYALALFGLLLFSPFSVFSFVQGNTALGAASLSLIIVLAYNAWSTHRQIYKPILLTLVLAPLSILLLSLAITAQGMFGVLWAYPTLLSFYIMLPERNAWVANALLVLIVGPVSLTVLDTAICARVMLTLLTVSVVTAAFVRIVSAQQKRMVKLVGTDPLTGVLNRTSLFRVLEDARLQAATTGIPVTLLALDLDNFKSINDTYGHHAGDEVLSALGSLLQKNSRITDTVFRMGGEEFLILLKGSNRANSLQVAEKIRQNIQAYPFVDKISVTASLGIAQLRSSESLVDWCKRADDKLYAAKRAGRNRIEH